MAMDRMMMVICAMMMVIGDVMQGVYCDPWRAAANCKTLRDLTEAELVLT